MNMVMLGNVVARLSVSDFKDWVQEKGHFAGSLAKRNYILVKVF